MLKQTLLALLLLAAPAIFAQQDAVRIFPPGPTDETPITLSFTTSCPRNDTFTVQKSADEVLLVVKAGGTCGSPPIDVTSYIPIGTLPAGSYKLAYTYQGSGEVFRQSAVINVRHASSPAQFDVHPFAIRTNPAGLRMTLIVHDDVHAGVCGTADCSDTTFRVGGVAATNVTQVVGKNAVTFDAPPHAVGFADVAVEKPGETWTYPDAVYYFDSPDPSIFERVLFPVLFNAAGANGSDWLSEAVVSNPNPWFVENYNRLEPIVCITFPCGERLSPGQYNRIHGASYPNGAVLLVPRSEADGLAYSLRVRDTSREAEGFGTEIPVVREKNMLFNRAITLLEVPLDPRYRVKVRTYAFAPPNGTHVRIKVMNPVSKAVKSDQFLPLTKPCDTCASYAELDLPAGAASEFVSIYVTAPEGSLAWAFATVTNNSTQQVTVVTPAGGSGEP